MIDCRILSSEKVILDERADMVIIPSASGELGILPGHPSLLAILRPGQVRLYKMGEVSISLTISEGIASVTDKGCEILI